MPRHVRTGLFCLVVSLLFCPAPMAFGLAESTAPNGTNAQAVHTLGEIGEGINVGFLASGTPLITHEAFDSHAFSEDYTDNGLNINSHDTVMAGIVASRGGASYPNDVGVASGADIHTMRVVDSNSLLKQVYLTPALDELILTRNCRVIMTGFAVAPETGGSSIWSKMYDYYSYYEDNPAYDVVFANAAGNNNTYISIFGDAFNGITTGGLIITDPDVYNRVGSLSGSGPLSDGRLKPDVTTPSQNQTTPNAGGTSSWSTVGTTAGYTSYAVPHTAGVAALLAGLAEETAEPDDGHNDLIRAVIVNSTFPNINDKDNNPTTGQTHDDDRGYGRIDALKAYQLLAADNVTTYPLITQQKGWAHTNIDPNGDHSYFIEAQKNHRLVLTVTWNSKVTRSGYTYTRESTLFNLDLTILDSIGTELYSETNSVNNLEKAEIILPADDTYEIILDNTTNKSRNYALAFELIPPITADFDVNYIVDMADMAVFAIQWLTEGQDLEADIWPDGVVNELDLTILAENWLTKNPAYN